MLSRSGEEIKRPSNLAMVINHAYIEFSFFHKSAGGTHQTPNIFSFQTRGAINLALGGGAGS